MAAFWQTYGWVVLGLTAGAGWGMSYLLYEKILLKFPVSLVMFITGSVTLAFFGALSWWRGHLGEIKTITETIDDLDDTLLRLDERVAEFERNIKERFANLEIILGRLNTQKESFSSSIANLANLKNG